MIWLMQSIILVQMSDFNPAVLEGLRGAAEAAFTRSVEIRQRITRLTYAYDPIREQYKSPLLLTRLKHFKRGAGDKILGVVNVDLYSPGFDYIYGEADIADSIATLSLHRLHRSSPASLTTGLCLRRGPSKRRCTSWGTCSGWGTAEIKNASCASAPTRMTWIRKLVTSASAALSS
jgi:hypothetical protein